MKAKIQPKSKQEKLKRNEEETIKQVQNKKKESEEEENSNGEQKNLDDQKDVKIKKKEDEDSEDDEDDEEGEQKDLKDENEEELTFQESIEKTAFEFKELIHISSWNTLASTFATTPDPETGELVRTNLLLIEPRSTKQLKDDGGFHFDWIDNFIVTKSKNQSSGVVLILVRNDNKNTLVPLVEDYINKEINWIIHSKIIIKDGNPRKNTLSRSKDLQFTSSKQTLYVMVQKGSKVIIKHLNYLTLQLSRPNPEPSYANWMYDIWDMNLPSTRNLIGKTNNKGSAIHPQENSFELYETLIQLFTSDGDMVGHIYSNVGKMGGVATVMNRSFWGVEPNVKMVEEGSTAIAEYILTQSQEAVDNTEVSLNSSY